MSIKKKITTYSVAAIGVVALIRVAALFFNPASVFPTASATKSQSNSSQGTQASTTQQGVLFSTRLVLLIGPPQVPNCVAPSWLPTTV